MNLRIRLLESPPKTEPELLKEMHISTHDDCGQPMSTNEGSKPFTGPLLRISLNQNSTLHLRPIAEWSINIIHVFLHQSRIFYINVDSDMSSNILSDRGKFITWLPRYFPKGLFGPFWSYGEVVSYDERLLYVPSLKYNEDLVNFSLLSRMRLAAKSI